MSEAAVNPRIQDRARDAAFRIRPYLTFANLSLAFMLLCCLLIGKFEQYETYFSLAMLAVILLNWKNEEFYIFSAIFLFFWEQFYVIAGSTPLYRIYSYLLVLRFVFDIGKARFRTQFLLPLAVMALFCLISVGRMSMRTGLNLLADALICFMVLTQCRQNPPLMRKLTLVFTFTAICAGFYSVMAETVVSYETGIGAQVEIVRYYGTLGDANYAGCFYNAAIFMALCSDYMKKWYIRVPIVLTLLYFLLQTASQTGLLCFTIGIAVILLLKYRLAGIPIVMVFGAFVAMFAYALIYVPAVRNFGPLTSISNRLIESLFDAETGNIVSLTTNRATLWKIAMDYFRDLPLLNKFIGGSVVATIISEEYFLKTVGAIHQTYIQGLLDFGILGAVAVFGTRVWQTMSDVFCYYRGKDMQLPPDLMCCSIMSVFTFLLYAFTIDMFMDWRFLYLFFF